MYSDFPYSPRFAIRQHSHHASPPLLLSVVKTRSHTPIGILGKPLPVKVQASMQANTPDVSAPGARHLVSDPKTLHSPQFPAQVSAMSLWRCH